MMRTLTRATLAVACIISATACQRDPSVPSYRSAVEDFQRQRPPGRLADEDRQVMERAAADLAARMPSPGLALGDKAPDFVLPNALGNEVRLSDVLRKGPVVLTFYRGAWCPYCNLELHALQESLPAFRQRGATLIAVTPQKPDKSREQIEKEQYGFEILSDLDSAVMKKYKLYFEVPKELSTLYKQKFGIDLEAYNGKGRAVLPVPGTFVIDQKGIIRRAYAHADYKRRMEPADIVEALDGLSR